MKVDRKVFLIIRRDSFIYQTVSNHLDIYLSIYGNPAVIETLYVTRFSITLYHTKKHYFRFLENFKTFTAESHEKSMTTTSCDVVEINKLLYIFTVH